MKKYLNFAFVSAIALTGTLGFTACSSEDKIDDTAATPNPTYDATAQTVNVNFVLNVSSEANTRQSSNAVQQNANFRGMTDAKLIGLATGKSSWLAPFAGGTTTTDWTSTTEGIIYSKTYDLGTLYGSTAVDNSSGTNASGSSRRVLQLTMPLKTDAMLVYARAIGGSATDGTNTDEGNGKVNITMDPRPENITFDLVSRLGTKQTEYNEACNLAALIINRILKSEVGEIGAGQYDHGGLVNVNALPAISWRGLGAAEKASTPLPPLQENLAVVFNTVTTYGTNEVRGGSASAVCNMIYNVYGRINSVINATPTTDGELNAQRLAAVIKQRIDNYFEVAATEAATKFRPIGNASEANTIINGLVTVAQVMTLEEYNTQFSHVEHGDLQGFPTSFKLPFGAAQLYYTAFNADASEGGFSYKNKSTSLLDLNAEIEASHYMYPSELLYFDNSSIFVSDLEKAVGDYPNGYNTWDSYTWASNGWTNDKVVSTTRSVAVKNNINYGVAMLQTKVQLDGTSFNDNRHAVVPSEANQVLSQTDVQAFKLTGVIVGGQNHQLGWNYLAKANEATDWDYAIFDNTIPSGTIPTGSGDENYTLVFDNYHTGDQAAQVAVLVALEFENNSEKDFYGKGNLIRRGGKFYLIGKLQLGDKRIGTETGTSWPTTYPIPPYTAAGASQEITRVFIQDYLTTATFKIGSTSLQNAFITVPDLRATQASLGLSVDLNWRKGLSFEYVLGQ
jgi:hypothetical protein